METDHTLKGVVEKTLMVAVIPLLVESDHTPKGTEPPIPAHSSHNHTLQGVDRKTIAGGSSSLHVADGHSSLNHTLQGVDRELESEQSSSAIVVDRSLNSDSSSSFHDADGLSSHNHTLQGVDRKLDSGQSASTSGCG